MSWGAPNVTNGILTGYRVTVEPSKFEPFPRDSDELSLVIPNLGRFFLKMLIKNTHGITVAN